MDARKFFSEHATDYVRYARWSREGRVLEASVKMIERLPVRVAIDLGCGNCSLLSALTQIPTKIGIDISYNMLALCRNEPVLRVVGDMHNTPLPPSIADLLISRQSFRYGKKTELIHEMHRLLKPNGWLHVSLLTDYEEADPEWRKKWVSLRGIKIRTFYTATQLRLLFGESGFDLKGQEDVFLHEHYSWNDFFKKNLVNSDGEEHVKQLFGSADKVTAEAYRLVCNQETLSFRRKMSFFLFQKAG